MIILYWALVLVGGCMFTVGLIFTLFCWLGITWATPGTAEYSANKRAIDFGLFIALLGAVIFITMHLLH